VREMYSAHRLPHRLAMRYREETTAAVYSNAAKR
jgi:hypothetical protein